MHWNHQLFGLTEIFYLWKETEIFRLTFDFKTFFKKANLKEDNKVESKWEVRGLQGDLN